MAGVIPVDERGGERSPCPRRENRHPRAPRDARKKKKTTETPVSLGLEKMYAETTVPRKSSDREKSGGDRPPPGRGHLAP